MYIQTSVGDRWKNSLIKALPVVHIPLGRVVDEKLELLEGYYFNYNNNNYGDVYIIIVYILYYYIRVIIVNIMCNINCIYIYIIYI